MNNLQIKLYPLPESFALICEYQDERTDGCIEDATHRVCLGITIDEQFRILFGGIVVCDEHRMKIINKKDEK